MGASVGTQVGIIDKLNPEIIRGGTIKYIEVDNEHPDLYICYIRANDEELNTKTDERFPFTYWEIMDLASEYLILDYEVV